jgi:hypothetical protein
MAKRKNSWQFTWTFQYELLLKKAWRVCWFGKNRDLHASRQIKEELIASPCIEFERGNLRCVW